MRRISVRKSLVCRSVVVVVSTLLVLLSQMVANAPLVSAMTFGEQFVDGVVMVHVPKGCFYFDDPRTDGDAPGPSNDYRCFESGFWIDKYEVTNGDFIRLHGQSVIPSDSKHPRQPRAHIIWYEADAFCKLREALLPDETDWEYAARGPKNLLYPNGNDLKYGTFAGFHLDGADGVVADVGSYPASASWVGAQDMIGNVWEWTAMQPEWTLRPFEERIRDQRVIRGGSVSFSDNFDTAEYRTAFRMSADANNEAWDAGFRCIKPEESVQNPTATKEFPVNISTDTSTPISVPRPGTIDPNATLISAGTNNSTWMPVAQTFGDTIMDYVPAGCFDMGTDFIEGTDNPTDPSFRNENPQHRVCLTAPYWIDQYEVTNAQYKKLTGKALSILADSGLPVSPISWNDADAFCKLRGDQLPTEAQWEYAARGPQSLLFPWGNDFDSVQNSGFLNPNSRSWVGTFDFSESVMEWVADWYALDAYSQSVLNDPHGPPSGVYRVLRGGSYNGDLGLSGRAAYRNFNRPDVPAADAGIRCIRPIQSTTNPTATVSPIVPTPQPTSVSPTASSVTPILVLIPAGTANTIWTPITATFKGIPMQRVPAGCFIRGDADTGLEYGYPKHEICITKPFWIDQTEVTNEAFTRLGGRALIDTRFFGIQRPRNDISWGEAHAFCIARGGHLPTEAQWEFAAQGPEGLNYPWGNDEDYDKEVYYQDYRSRPANVGSRPAGASWIGALDMAGNVSEWGLDWNNEDYIKNTVRSDPPGPEQGTERVTLGSSYVASPYGMPFLMGWRDGFPPATRHHWIGFRCILPDSAKPDALPSPSSTPAIH